MKKALSVFLMLALVGSVFAAEPVADVNIAEFKGDASVQWGVDLDTMKTGFKNDTSVSLKLNLLNGGEKSTTGDGIWGELVIKTDGDTFAEMDKNTSLGKALSGMDMNIIVDKAQINFGPAYVGIKAGDTQTGELKMDAAIRSADSDNAKWLSNVGPENYTQGIVAGYSHDMFNVAVDFRSFMPSEDVTVVTWSGPIVIFEGRTSPAYFASKDVAQAFKNRLDVALAGEGTSSIRNMGDVYGGTQYTNAYAFAAEAEFTGVENLSVKAGVSYDFGEEVQQSKYSTLGYSTSVGYKLGLTDTFYLRPQLGFAGKTNFGVDGKFEIGNKTVNDIKVAATQMNVAAGVLFGWGDIGIDANADVPFLDGDSAKKVSPGVGVVASIPLPAFYSASGSSNAKLSGTVTGNLAARIMPSFYSGEIIPGLTAAAYADVGIMQDAKVNAKAEVDNTKVDFPVETTKAPDTPFAVAFGAKYAIPVAAMTITPNMGLRYANETYHSNLTEVADAVFPRSDMGEQTDSKIGYLNVKAGVDVAGLVSNTTFSIIYDSANLLNANKNEGAAKLGTLNFKTKISF